MKLHATQSKVFHDTFIKKTHRHTTIRASRGWGKSVMGSAAVANIVGELTKLPAWVPNKNIAIVTPTYSQTVDIYYPLLAYQFGLEAYATKYSRDKGYFNFPNDVTLNLVSAEAVERQRGFGNYFVLVDEITSMSMKEQKKLDMVESILMPTIDTRWSPLRVSQIMDDIRRETGESIEIYPGRFMAISTPKGYDTFYDLCNRGKLNPDWRTYHFDYKQSPYLDSSEIELASLTTDPIRFAREYKASFEDSGNNVFYCFNRDLNVIPTGSIKVHPEEPLHIPIDFNVRKQCSSVWVIRGLYAICVGYIQGSADTHQLAATIYGRYVTVDRPPNKIYCYPDPSGRAAKTSAVVGTTDFTILEGYQYNVLARSAHPSIIDSVNACNARFQTADNPITGQKGKRFAFVEAANIPVIESLARTQWVDNNADTALIDKSQDIEHFSDGVRYFFDYHWPIKRERVAVRGFGF